MTQASDDSAPRDAGARMPMALAAFTIHADHPSLAGHFPGNPIVPGVVLLDQVLQTMEATHAPIGALRMAQVKFMQPLLPGQPARVLLEGAAPRWRFRVLRAAVLQDAADRGAAGTAGSNDVLLASGDVAIP